MADEITKTTDEESQETVGEIAPGEVVPVEVVELSPIDTMSYGEANTVPGEVLSPVVEPLIPMDVVIENIQVETVKQVPDEPITLGEILNEPMGIPISSEPVATQEAPNSTEPVADEIPINAPVSISETLSETSTPAEPVKIIVTPEVPKIEQEIKPEPKTEQVSKPKIEQINTPIQPAPQNISKQKGEVVEPNINVTPPVVRTALATGGVVHAPSVSPLDSISLLFVANMKRARELLVKARAVIQTKKRKKLEKVMGLFTAKKKKIKNKDVRDLLHITDETATVYLKILEKEGKIKQEGKGGWTYYTKI